MKILNPEAFWLFLLIPLVIMISLLLHRRSLRSLALLGYGRQSALTGVYRVRNFARVTVFLFLLSFAILSLADFHWGVEPVVSDNNDLDVAIVLDISNSMTAGDAQGSRLDRCRDGIFLMLDTLEGTRFSFTLFKGDGVVFIPMTEDLIALKNLLTQISPALITASGTDLEEALREAAATLPDNQERNRTILLFTDGENQKSNVLPYVRELFDRGIRVFTFGVGLTEGGTPLYLSDGRQIVYESGEPVYSVQNDDLLKEIARITGGSYTDLTEVQALSYLGRELSEEFGLKENRGVRFQVAHRYRIFLGGALLLLLCYMFMEKLPWHQ